MAGYTSFLVAAGVSFLFLAASLTASPIFPREVQEHKRWRGPWQVFHLEEKNPYGEGTVPSWGPGQGYHVPYRGHHGISLRDYRVPMMRFAA